MKVAIVGAGIHGVSTALELALRGHEVTVFERDRPASASGSSHGRSRIIRKAYSDPFYTEIMERAYPLWDRLKAASAKPIVHQSGLVYLGDEDSPTIRDVRESLDANRVAHTVSHDVREWLPGLHSLANEVGIFTPEAGWVHAEHSVAATWQWAVSLGARLEMTDIREPAILENNYDRIILCAGEGLRKWLDLPVEVRVQTVAYVDQEYSGSVWIEDGPDFLYGFPSAPNERGVKIGVHNRGAVWPLGAERPGPDAESISLIRDFAVRRWRRPNVQIIETSTCVYSIGTNEDFMWGQIGEKFFWVSACSGHGFKFGPWIGQKMADFVEAKDTVTSNARFFRNIGWRGT